MGDFLEGMEAQGHDRQYDIYTTQGHDRQYDIYTIKQYNMSPLQTFINGLFDATAFVKQHIELIAPLLTHHKSKCAQGSLMRKTGGKIKTRK